MREKPCLKLSFLPVVLLIMSLQQLIHPFMGVKKVLALQVNLTPMVVKE